MLARLLEALAAAVLRRPRALWLAAAAPAVLIALTALWTPIDLSFSGLMDREHPEVARYFKASEAYGLGGQLPLLIEGPEDTIDAGRSAIAEALRADPAVRAVIDPAAVDQDWLLANLPWLIPAEDFELWKRLAEEPSSSERAAALIQRVGALQRELETRVEPPAGARLLLVTLAHDSLELDLDDPSYPRLARRVDEVLADFGVEGRFAGMPAIVHQDQAQTLGRIAVLTPVSLLLVLLLLTRFDRRPLGLLAIAAPMILAGAAAVALTGFLLGTITIMESIFGVMVFGLGVDFALHLGLRAREEVDRGASFDEALRVAFKSTGAGVVTGGLTTAGAFLLVALAPELTFRHLGISGGIGVGLCMLLMLILLPASWVLLGRRAPAGGRRPGTMGPLARGVAAVADHATRRPWLHVGLALLLATISAAGLPSLRYETDLRAVVNRSLDAVAAADRISERFGVDPGPWVFAARDLERAREITDALVAEPAFARVESVTRLFPPDLEQRAAWISERRDAIAQTLAADDAELALGDSYAMLELLLAADGLGPPSPDGLPGPARARFATDAGELLIYAFSAEPHMDSDKAARERELAQAIDPSATSIAVLFEVLIGSDRPWMRWVLGLVVAFILALLVVDLRRPALVFMALVPVLLGTVITAGALAWFGIALNTVTVLALPLLVGLGVDDGIHVVHRLREEARGSERDAVASVGTAIAMTTATTCASFATLALSGHPGMESLGLTMLIGLPLCLLASISTLPALAVVIRRARA